MFVGQHLHLFVVGGIILGGGIIGFPQVSHLGLGIILGIVGSQQLVPGMC